MALYADVIVPIPVAGTFTYRIPDMMKDFISAHYRVVVPFGKKHYYTGLVIKIHDQKPESLYELKEIFALLDKKPAIHPYQLHFWQWIATYYICGLGEVFKAALPSGLKLESETVVTFHPEYEAEAPLKANEQKILDTISSSVTLSVSELERVVGMKNIFPAIHALLEKGAIRIYESLKQGFKEKTETFVCLPKELRSDSAIENMLDLLKRAKQQERLFLAYLELGGLKREAVSKKQLLHHSGVSPTLLSGLVKKGLLVLEERTVSRIVASETDTVTLSVLSKAQQNAYEAVLDSFKTKDITLLYGVAASGKTEIYIHLIHDMLSKGLQVLYLLPEIAMTTQITERLRQVFGAMLFVYHSGYSDNERVEVWDRLLRSEEPLVVLGIRSSVFLPFKRLGLIIVDEEHDASYKQQEPAPRYHARNTAMMLAIEHGGKVLLGSATPSLESYSWAIHGKYGYVKLLDRYCSGGLPLIEIENIRELRRRKQMKNALFSPLLTEKISEALKKNEQVILFQNRRGFVPMIVCQACGEIPHCIYCDVSLTFHKLLRCFVCHYCGYTILPLTQCPSCGSSELMMQGFGTEKVEEEIAILFPLAKTARLDTDTARARSALKRILTDFEEGKTQILIGTQMVSKGFDFEHVGVVGILSADGLMNIPDFRADERAFQLLLQISGCAGRRDRRGTVVIQTSQPEHPVLQIARQFDYEKMAQSQLKERLQFRYPPYTRLIIIILRCRNEEIVDKFAKQYADRLLFRLGSCVSPPIHPPVTRIQTFFIRKIMLKMDLSVPVAHTRKILEEVYREFQPIPLFKQVLLHHDVDPQ